MRKNFHIIDGLKIGGIEKLALTLSSQKILNEENYLININKNINYYSRDFFNKKLFNKLKIISLKRKKGIFTVLVLIKYFLKNRPSNIIIYFNNITSLWVVLSAKFLGINNIAICIQNAIGSASKKNKKLLFLMHFFNNLNVKLVPCSIAIRNSFLKIDKKIKFSEVIPNCINVNSFTKELQKIKKTIKPKRTKTIIMVARLDNIKDQETLLRAYSKIKKKANLILVGDGKNRKKLEDIALDLGLKVSEIFLGSRIDIHNLLAKADIFAFSTTSAEGFGIALIEAMAAKLPIIATDVPACREVLDNGKAGILIPSGRVDLWTIKINQLISSKKIRDFYIDKSIQNLKKYDSKQISKKWINLFNI